MKLCTNFGAIVLLIAMMPMLLGSCSQKYEEPKAQENVEETQPQGTLRSVDIATILSDGDFSISDFASLASSIQTNAEIGYDEKVYLSDLSTLRSTDNSFATKLLQKLNTSSLRSATNSDFSLYWRSCQAWNKTERPVVAYVSEETPENAKEIPAFELDENGKIVNTIMIDEEYTKNHPTLIVNGDEKPKGKIIPIRPKGYISNLIVPSIDYSKLKIIRKRVTSLYLGDLQVSEQFDCWFNGGSEICFVVAYPRAVVKKDGNVEFEDRTTYQCRYVTRDQIDNEEILHLDYDLVLDWDPYLNRIGWFAYEDDSTWAAKGSVEFKFSYKGFDFTAKATVPNTKEKIVKTDYTGSYLMSTDNIDPDTKQWKMHKANGIKYTLPVKIADVLPSDFFHTSDLAVAVDHIVEP